MKLGFFSACLQDLTIDKVILWASEVGFHSIELPAWPEKTERNIISNHLMVEKIDLDESKRIKDLALKHQIEFSSLGFYANQIDENYLIREKNNEHLKRVIDTAALLGINYVGTFVGGRIDLIPSEIIREARKTFQGLCEYAEQKDVSIMIENCPMVGWQRFGVPGNFAYSPELWDALFNEIPNENFGLNFDPSHLYWLDIDIIRCVEEYFEKIFHIHAKDTEVCWEYMHRYGIYGKQLANENLGNWWRYRIPGKGEIDWKTFISVIEELGYDGTLSIELEDPVYEGSEQKVKSGLQYSLKYLSQFVI